ncbi:MAG: ROK family protein [Lachnospiraceae bacterium]|nr:ROK family protein [Lachnospiraceae bacterium]MCI8960897.1 ROK family protein [Lachnospiraceae bacterium]
MKEYIGIDIGGTKCAVVRGNEAGEILDKRRFPTRDRDGTLEAVFDHVQALWSDQVAAIGVSCGGPLDSRRGVILGPPNLPGWEEVYIVRMLEERFHVPAYLANDADACAVAEWKFGAGKGCENLIFLTFGTGLGAGLILNGRLYPGTSGMAGEVGHVRLYPQGHVGYNKAGSFEGYVSGGGIAQYGLGDAASLGERAAAGDLDAIRLWERVGEDLGRLLALLMDILNPEMIVIGSVFVRAGAYMREAMEQVLEREALAASREACRVVPAALGESLGDMAALGIAMAGNTQ